MSLIIDIRNEAGAWPDVEPLIEDAAAAAIAAARLTHRDGAELSVVLTDDAGIARINADWRGKAVPTNVLSFPAEPADRIAAAPLLGDIVLAYDTLAREADAEGKSFADHLAHLVIHGVLHLFGHDHRTETEAEAMEALERLALARLGIADPYRDAA